MAIRSAERTDRAPYSRNGYLAPIGLEGPQGRRTAKFEHLTPEMGTLLPSASKGHKLSLATTVTGDFSSDLSLPCEERRLRMIGDEGYIDLIQLSVATTMTGDFSSERWRLCEERRVRMIGDGGYIDRSHTN
nr:hypothetical protein Iba_chr04cCG17180 [Ipomoea batatas]